MNEDDLEMVLNWRNSEHIRQYASTKEIIDLQTHTRWFHTLKEKGDLYFIIETDNKAVGLIWANKFIHNSCETGMYIYETEIQNTLFAYKASLTLNDYLFNTKNLDSITCEILHENSRSIRYTLSLNYKEQKKNDTLIWYVLRKVDFIPNFKKISKLLNKSIKK